MATKDISDLSWSDVIDLRDVTDRVEELRDLIEADEAPTREREEAYADEHPEHKPEPTECGTCGRSWDDSAIGAPAGRCPFEYSHEELEELAKLESLLDEIRGTGGDHQWERDWYPGTMIAESYFVTYAKDLAEDIGALKEDAGWPARHIDWEEAAADLAQDYSLITFEGSDWYVR
jgi:hypothetical protein